MSDPPLPKIQYPEVEDGIEEFWGQLWFIPQSESRIQPPRVSEEVRASLVWVRKDLWEQKQFRVGDCYKVGSEMYEMFNLRS